MTYLRLPCALPTFVNDIQSSGIVDAYEVLGYCYDGFRNKVRIQPYKEGQPVGQDYTITPGHLSTLIEKGEIQYQCNASTVRN